MRRWADVERALRAAYRRCGPSLGQQVTDAMSFPAYLEGVWASRYVARRKLTHVVWAAGLRPASRVLDFGCGSGVLLPRLCDCGRVVQATDLHLEPARVLVERLGLSQVEFIPADSWADAVPDAAVETIVAANVLEHIERRRPLVAAFRRKLTASGRLVVSGPTENAFYRLGRRLVGFSGRYHVAGVEDVLKDVLAEGLRMTYVRNWPLPGPTCLYTIAAFAAQLY